MKMSNFFTPSPAVLLDDNNQVAPGDPLDRSAMIRYMLRTPDLRDKFMTSLMARGGGDNEQVPRSTDMPPGNHSFAARATEDLNAPYINFRNGLLNMLGVDLSPNQKVQQDFLTISKNPFSNK